MMCGWYPVWLLDRRPAAASRQCIALSAGRDTRSEQVVDLGRFRWQDDNWPGPGLNELVIYELQIGTLTREGTFLTASERLTYLKELGVNAIQLMPVGDFPGRWNWGYDGVVLFASARCYGSPQELQSFVDRAYRLGIAVFRDVIYNHLGPHGNYLRECSRHYLSAN